MAKKYFFLLSGVEAQESSVMRLAVLKDNFGVFPKHSIMDCTMFEEYSKIIASTLSIRILDADAYL